MTVAPSPQPPAERPARTGAVSAVLLLESAVAGVVGAFLATGSLSVTAIAAVVTVVCVALLLWFLTR